MTLIYIYFLLPEIREAIIWPSRDVLNGLLEYLSLAVPSAIAFSATWFCFEIYVLIAGNLSAANQACTSIAISIIVIHDIIREGGIQGTCAYIGGEIATMRINFAKRSYRVIVWLEFAMNFIFVTLLTTNRKQIAHMYAPNDKKLCELLQIVLPLAGLICACMFGT